MNIISLVLPSSQGMTPISKIAIAISIAISKKIADRDHDRSFAIADRDRDQFTYCVDKVFFISFIGKLVHNHLQKWVFFRNCHYLSSVIFEIFDLPKVDC